MNTRNPLVQAVLLLGCTFLAASASSLAASPPAASAQVPALVAAAASSTTTTAGSESGSSLEAAANRAGDLSRKIAVSLIGLGLAVAAIRLVFRRNFKEASGVVVLGLLAVLLASPVGESLLQNTVNAVFGS
jgi:hypothetical protein